MLLFFEKKGKMCQMLINALQLNILLKMRN